VCIDNQQEIAFRGQKKKKKKLHPDLPISAIAIRILIPRQGKGNIDVFLRLFKTPKDKVLK
jgi:hypothetical protein